MWKNCQAFRARYESVLSDSTRPPSLYPQRILADFWAGLGILIIEGKNKKGSATRLGLSLSGTHEHASLQSAAGYWLPATRSLRSFHPRPSSAEVLSIQMRRQFLVCFQIHPCHFLANPPIPSRPPRPKARGKSFVFRRMPQSKTALLQTTQMQQLATVPYPGGGGLLNGGSAMPVQAREREPRISSYSRKSAVRQGSADGPRC
jgi:hypothetical protein